MIETTSCSRCGGEHESVSLFARRGEWPRCARCDRLVETYDEYFHVPKLFTWRGVASQFAGVRPLARALVLNARGRTELSREAGRIRAVVGCVRYWARAWLVFERRSGWVVTPRSVRAHRAERRGRGQRAA